MYTEGNGFDCPVIKVGVNITITQVIERNLIFSNLAKLIVDVLQPNVPQSENSFVVFPFCRDKFSD